MNEGEALYLAHTVGRVFERSVEDDCDCETFVSNFMMSDVARRLGLPWDYIQGQGDAYIEEEFLKDYCQPMPPYDKRTSPDAMYWMGYVYCYWNTHTNISYGDMYGIADFKTMRLCYGGLHVMDPKMAIENLIARARDFALDDPDSTTYDLDAVLSETRAILWPDDMDADLDALPRG